MSRSGQVDLVADRLEHREQVVDHRVDQRVHEVSGATSPNAGRAGPQAQPDRFEQVAGSFAHRQHEAGLEDDADLLLDQVAGVLVGEEVIHHREQRVAILLDLRSLANVDHVLERQRVDRQPLPEFGDDVRVVALHVQPQGLSRLWQRKILRPCQLVLVQRLEVVLSQSHPHRFCRGLAPCQGSGRGAGGVASLEQLHVVLPKDRCGDHGAGGTTGPSISWPYQSRSRTVPWCSQQVASGSWRKAS
jgi:hypothetical protein